MIDMSAYMRLLMDLMGKADKPFFRQADMVRRVRIRNPSARATRVFYQCDLRRARVQMS